jgi:hypothetical protein
MGWRACRRASRLLLQHLSAPFPAPKLPRPDPTGRRCNHIIISLSRPSGHIIIIILQRCVPVLTLRACPQIMSWRMCVAASRRLLQRRMSSRCTAPNWPPRDTTFPLAGAGIVALGFASTALVGENQPVENEPIPSKELHRFIDHTCLKPEATPQDIEKLVKEAVAHDFYSVCVNPVFVRLAKRLLKEVSRPSVGYSHLKPQMMANLRGHPFAQAEQEQECEGVRRRGFSTGGHWRSFKGNRESAGHSRWCRRGRRSSNSTSRQ